MDSSAYDLNLRMSETIAHFADVIKTTSNPRERLRALQYMNNLVRVHSNTQRMIREALNAAPKIQQRRV